MTSYIFTTTMRRMMTLIYPELTPSGTVCKMNPFVFVDCHPLFLHCNIRWRPLYLSFCSYLYLYLYLFLYLLIVTYTSLHCSGLYSAEDRTQRLVEHLCRYLYLYLYLYLCMFAILYLYSIQCSREDLVGLDRHFW